MNPIIIIPARLAATRLPGKPLADIAGRPMILHVLDRAREAGLGPVVVAAGDLAIAAAVRGAGGVAIMTDPALASGSDRVQAALAVCDPGGTHDVVINLQGDLPSLPAGFLAACVGVLGDSAVDVGTLVAAITGEVEAASSSIVKAACGFASGQTTAPVLYFSRALVPWGKGPLWHHIGIYAYRRAALARFVALPPSPLEMREKLEQLRALEAGMRIAAARVDLAPRGVDTQADLDAIRQVFAARVACA